MKHCSIKLSILYNCGNIYDETCGEKETRAVTRKHSSPVPVLAHYKHKVLNSKSIRKVMLLPYNILKQSEYNLPFRHINKSMTLTSVINRNWGGII